MKNRRLEEIQASLDAVTLTPQIDGNRYHKDVDVLLKAYRILQEALKELGAIVDDGMGGYVNEVVQEALESADKILNP